MDHSARLVTPHFACTIPPYQPLVMVPTNHSFTYSDVLCNRRAITTKPIKTGRRGGSIACVVIPCRRVSCVYEGKIIVLIEVRGREAFGILVGRFKHTKYCLKFRLQQFSMSYQLYRNTTLGNTLQESLDELIQVSFQKYVAGSVKAQNRTLIRQYIGCNINSTEFINCSAFYGS